MGVAPLAKPPGDLSQTMRGPAPGVDLTRTAKPDLNVTMRGTKPPMPTGARTPPPASTPPPIPAHARQPTPSAALPVVKPQRMATPFAPMPVGQKPAAPVAQQPAPPIVAPERPPMPEIEVSEPTDLTAIPQLEDVVPDGLSDSTIPIAVQHEAKERTIREPRKTTIGVAVVPSGVMVLPAAPALRTPSDEEIRDTGLMDVPTAPTAQITVRGDAIDDVDALSPTLHADCPIHVGRFPWPPAR